MLAGGPKPIAPFDKARPRPDVDRWMARPLDSVRRPPLKHRSSGRCPRRSDLGATVSAMSSAYHGTISFALAVVCACRAGAPPDGAIARDSAGIRIVSNPDGAQEANSGWVIEQKAAVVFGRDPSDSVTLLLNPVGAVRLSDGRVVVADRGASSVKIFAATGELTQTVGREGDGPGEFRYISRLRACHGDSAFVEDIVHRTLAVVAPTGLVARTFALRTPEPGRPAFELACNRSGDILTSGWGETTPTAQDPYRPIVPVALAGPDGEVRVVLGQFPGTEMVPEFRGATARRMGRRLALAMGSQRAWVATGETADLLGFDRRGSLREIVRTPASTRAPTDRDVAWHRQLALDSARADGRLERVSQQLAAMTVPATLPPIVTLLVDSEDHLWVQRYPAAGESQGPWVVYEPRGILLGGISMPPGLSPVAIGRDYVLGLFTAEDGSRWVQLHQLNRGERHPPGT